MITCHLINVLKAFQEATAEQIPKLGKSISIFTHKKPRQLQANAH